MQRPGELAPYDEFIRPHDYRLLRFKLRQADPACLSDPQQLDRGDPHAVRGDVENLDVRTHHAFAELHSRVQWPSLHKA